MEHRDASKTAMSLSGVNQALMISSSHRGWTLPRVLLSGVRHAFRSMLYERLQTMLDVGCWVGCFACKFRFGAVVVVGQKAAEKQAAFGIFMGRVRFFTRVGM